MFRRALHAVIIREVHLARDERTDTKRAAQHFYTTRLPSTTKCRCTIFVHKARQCNARAPVYKLENVFCFIPVIII